MTARPTSSLELDPASAGTEPGAEPGAEPTVLASWTSTVVRALDARDLDGLGLAREAGIDLAVLHAGGRLPLSRTTELWRLAIDATGDPCFGIEVSRHVGPGTFHGLSVGVLASTTLREAIERIARFAPVVLSMPQRSEARARHDRFELRIQHLPETMGPHVPAPAEASIEAVLGSILRTARFLTRRRLSPLEVHLVRRARPSSDRFETFFGCPVTYGAGEYLLAFELDDVDRPLPSGCAEAALAADVTVADYLERVRPTDRVVDAVREAVTDLLAEGEASSSAVAARLAVSERTLQRRLRAEGASFRDLVVEVRMAQARHLLLVEGLTVEHVASRLGYGDTASFRRAFKRRTGTTPGRLAGRDGSRR